MWKCEERKRVHQVKYNLKYGVCSHHWSCSSVLLSSFLLYFLYHLYCLPYLKSQKLTHTSSMIASVPLTVLSASLLRHLRRPNLTPKPRNSSSLKIHCLIRLVDFCLLVLSVLLTPLRGLIFGQIISCHQNGKACGRYKKLDRLLISWSGAERLEPLVTIV